MAAPATASAQALVDQTLRGSIAPEDQPGSTPPIAADPDNRLGDEGGTLEDAGGAPTTPLGGLGDEETPQAPTPPLGGLGDEAPAAE